MFDLNEKLRKLFEKFNIDTFGVTDAFLYNSIMKTEYKSIIAALFPYYCGLEDNSNLSIYAHGKDYHKVIRKILLCVAEEAGLLDYAVHSDIGPCIERELAVNAGLCFRGRNSMCINEKYGSYFFIGYIACNENLEKSKPNTAKCMQCMKCVSACPGGALNNGFEAKKCLSEITQKKGVLTDVEMELIKKSGCAFGCDICQLVCPHNKNVKASEIADFVNDKITSMNLEELCAMSNREFMKKYGDRAFSWRGKGVLARNLEIINNQ